MAAPRLLLMALLVQWGSGAEPPDPPHAPPLECTMREGGMGGRGRAVVLRLWGGKAPPPGTPSDCDDTYDVIDPWGSLTQLWAPPWTPPHCELSPTEPVVTPPRWAPALGPPTRSPRGLEGSWWVLSLSAPTYGATALLQGRPRAPRELNATLTLSTLTPSLRAPFRSHPLLHCSFAPRGGPFALQWWHRDRGSGRRLLQYDSASNRVLVATNGAPMATNGAPMTTNGAPMATNGTHVSPMGAAIEGVLLVLGASGSSQEVSLRLRALSGHHRGTYGCSVFLPRGQAEVLLSMRVVEPPRVRLRPPRAALPPGGGGAALEVRCEAAGFFPRGAGLRWLLGGRPLAGGRSSAHRRAEDGSYGRSSAILLRQGALEEEEGGGLECEVTHEALREPLRVRLEVEVTGAKGPGAGDAVGLFLAAFVICGASRWTHIGCE